ncbi:hypothetical protein [Flavobacterium sp.]|uniref:hypothetical protein n=1 Tax=Flavobacterium sp. TaxID=239 RepID=UPI002B4B2BA8|nr:hypothetical protein [Flavobacterium sp.]HLP63248.1 hypothetical protein [Flavobacterium sp.]
MKNTITVLLFTVASFFSHAQLVQGEVKINEQSKAEITLKSNKIVNLYADFRDKKHQIHFVFTGIDIPQNSDKQEVVQFVFNTTVKKDGKVLGSLKRSPIPFFPGDMFMPVETFDFISILSNIQTNSNETISEIPKGNYEVILEAKPLGVKGEIQSARLFIKM